MNIRYAIWYAITVFSVSLYALQDSASELQVAVQAQTAKKVHIGLVTVGHDDALMRACADRLKKDLQWSNQAIVDMRHVDKLKKEKELKNLFDASVGVAIIVTRSGSQYAWRLYDLHGLQMIAGQKVDDTISHTSLIAHSMADEIWPQLFGQPSSFCSKIAYSKQIWRTRYGRQKPYKQIWISDFDGTNAQLFIDAPTVSFAPRWNNNPDCPLLFYSQNTLANVQLVMSNMFGKRKEICSFDGLNMQPTFSKDGSKVVFCLSKDGTTQLYLAKMNNLTHQRTLERLTFNLGNNIAPCFINDTQVAFVSDYQTHKPQIYMLDIMTKIVEPITDGSGYCACPNYSKVRNQLLYSKMIGSGMQLFVYDFAKKQHTQITFDKGSKEEGSWSPCGNYITFGLNQGLSSRIAQLHLPTKTMHYLTAESDHCTYPDCSPIYKQHIGILSR